MLKSRIICLVVVIALICPVCASERVNARQLTSRQQARAEQLAKICIEQWEKYGVLPSVCIGQALVESTLGEHCRGYNYWGINSGRGYNYSSIREGTMAYLKVINNGYYKGAAFQRDYHTQIKRILAGGYCQPVGDYYSNFCWLVNAYDLTKYDKQLFKALEKKKKKKQAEKLPNVKVIRRNIDNNYKGMTFTCKYDASLENCVRVSSTLAKSGTVSLWQDDVMMIIYDLKADNNIHNLRTIYVPDKKLDGKEIQVEFNQRARG